MVLWSIHTFRYKGFVENRENDKFEKGLYLSKIAAQTRRLIFRKVVIWYSEIEVECVAYTIQYLIYNIEYSMYEMTYSK